MKAKYYQDADLLSLRLSKDAYQYAKQDGDVIIHYSKDKEPVLIEIVNAAKFIQNTAKMLPKRIRKEMFGSTPSIAHRIK